MASNYRIVEIYLAVHTPVIPRSFNVHNLPFGLVNTYPSRKRTNDRMTALFKGVRKEAPQWLFPIKFLQV